MAIVKTDDKYYSEIAQMFRDIALTDGDTYAMLGSYLDRTFKPSEIASAILTLYERTATVRYNAGLEKGMEEGKQTGYEEGLSDGMAQYDAFWDVFQNNGEKANYYYAFAYGKFTDENYNPKHDIVCISDSSTSSRAMFYSAKNITSTKVPIYANGTSMQSAFYGCTSLVTIPLLVVHENLTYVTAFGACTALENITIEGVIGNDIDFSSCDNLTNESLASIAGHLSTTATGKTVTFSYECTSKYYISEADFSALTYGHENWTFALV